MSMTFLQLAVLCLGGTWIGLHIPAFERRSGSVEYDEKFEAKFELAMIAGCLVIGIVLTVVFNIWPHLIDPDYANVVVAK